MIVHRDKICHHDNILSCIGNTPLVRLNSVAAGLKPLILAKVEYLNPGGSVKDRIGENIIDEAVESGRLKPGGTIVESTSGNTGVGLAINAAVRGYKTVFVMPDKMSQEKIRLLRAYGAEVVVCPTAVPPDSPESYYEVAKRIVRETPNAIHSNQYFNPRNPETHVKSTGPEIWDATAGQIDVFVAGMGTGGTISGTGKFLKSKNPDVKVVGADPTGSILKHYFYTGEKIKDHPYKVEGIGEDFIPGTTHFEFVDDVVEVGDKESFLMARRLCREEGLFVGGSAGTAVVAALEVAKTMTEDQLMVVVLPDSGDRYLSKVFSDDWMSENGFLAPKQLTLEDLLRTKSGEAPAVVSVGPNQTVRESLALMRRYDLSQIPVLDAARSVGSLTEGHLTRQVLDDQSVFDQPVRDAGMRAPLPVLSPSEPVDNAAQLLARDASAVLVQQDGEIVGLLTRHDLVEHYSRA